MSRAYAFVIRSRADSAHVPCTRSSGRAGGPPPAAREAAALDLTGYWVSVVVEDWKWRMVTPKKGVADSLPLNAAARKVADAWDPKDEAAGESCRAYGAANVMRIPGRLHVTWEDAEHASHRHGWARRRACFVSVPRPP